MKCLDFDWQINEFMVYCRSTQLRERTMYALRIVILSLYAQDKKHPIFSTSFLTCLSNKWGVIL